MLSPEVWYFSPPPTKFTYKSGNIQSNSRDLTNLIDSHFFNHLVSVTLPDTHLVPDSVVNSLSQDCEYYIGKNIAISELLDKKFIDAFVKKGQLTILSEGTRIDTDDCVAITPTGHLLLSLQTETYQQLGIEGRPSFFSQKKPTRFVVDLDLRDEHFITGSKNYERVRLRLSKQPNFKFNLLIAWDPPSDTVCPSSVAAYLSSLGYEMSVHLPRLQKRIDYNVAVPLVQPDNDIHSCSSEELVEWLGAHNIGIDIKSGGPENYLSSYETPGSHQICGQVVNLQWTGFFTKNQVLQLFEEIRTLIKCKESSPWASIYVQGFADSLVSWGLKEHQYYMNGDNNFVMFLRPNDFYTTCSILSSNKRPTSKLSSK